jgi:hypothetical protein
MHAQVIAAIEGLKGLKVAALKIKYREIFCEDPKSSNRQFLFRRIAWQIQARSEGGLSQRAQHRAAEIADDADLRTRAPKGFLKEGPLLATSGYAYLAQRSRDWRVPPPGTLITRRLEGRDVVVKVLDKGFEYQSRRYRSLSAIAREVTGTQWNGPRFFGLGEERGG